ncbi:MAG: flagellar biosynthetic protein FliO [Deltaproteobacteria bacterium]|nr:flagellar biosynthetic protein FliO [Deltaproteobacteria bacterium]
MNPLAPSGPPEIAWPAIAAVAALTVVATVALWWLRGRGLLPAAAHPIRVVAMRSLGGRKSVAVVEVEDQRFLLGLSDEAVSLLSPLPSEAKASGGGAVAARSLGVAR